MANLDLKNIYEWPLTMRALVMGLVCVVVFYLGYLWDISSLSTQLISEKQTEKDLKERLQLIITKQKTVTEEVSQLSKFQDLLTLWQNKFIKYSDLPELINEILKIGAANHVHFDLFTPGAEMKEENFYIVPIKVVALGSYHHLSKFMSQVANMSSIVVIDNFTFSNEAKSERGGVKLAEKVDSENILTSEIILKVYYLADKK